MASLDQFNSHVSGFQNESLAVVVIPTLNEERHLERLVHKLLESSSHLVTRIVIADGGSHDNTPRVAKELTQRYTQIVYLHNPKKSQSAAVNLAVTVHGSGAMFLIRLDAHAEYPENYCNVLIEEALRTKADSVVVAMRSVGTTPFQKAAAATQNSALGNGASPHRCEGKGGRWVDHGHHALMRLESFRAVGGYDESFPQNEDAELDYRLAASGYGIWLTSKTHLTYYPRSSPTRLFRQYMGYGHGRARSIMKHGVRPKLRQSLPASVLPMMVLAMATPIARWACLPICLWLAFCFMYGGTLARGARGISFTLITTTALLMHTGWSLGFWKAVLTRPWRE